MGLQEPSVGLQEPSVGLQELSVGSLCLHVCCPHPAPARLGAGHTLAAQHRLWGWREGLELGGIRTPQPPLGSLSVLPPLVLPPPSCWGLLGCPGWDLGVQPGRRPLGPTGGAQQGVGPAPSLRQRSQASINALLVLIFMINIVFPQMVEISCALSLPQFTSLPAAGVVPDSGETEIRCQNSYFKSPLGKRPQIVSFLPKIDSKT